MAKRTFRTHRPLFPNTPPAHLKSPKFKWKLLPIIWLALKRTAMAIGFLVLINLFFALMVLPALLPQKSAAPSLPSEMVLFLSFDGGFFETPPPANFADPFANAGPTLKELIEGIDRATHDDRVKGIVARMYGGGFSFTQVTELRAAIKRFRESGKFAHIYSSSYGEGGGGLGRYYLASAFDEIWMQPLGMVSVNGVQAEVPYFRGLLDKLGVRPEFFKREKYKTAYESITDRSMSAENREMLGNIIDDIRLEVLERIPEDRGISREAFARYVDQGLFTAEEAVEASLITYADYGDVLLDNIAEAVTGERDPDALNLIEMDGYISVMKKRGAPIMGSGGGEKVALVYAIGPILAGDEDSFANDGIAAANEIAPAILEASDDENVKAIVLRIDSPGGSPSASESILRAVEKAQERGKPVIVSMGTTAASGGYWIAAYADQIFALPTTLTGSIGVVGGKFSFGELSENVGVNWESLGWGKNAGLFSVAEPFSQSEAQRYEAMLDNVYKNFIARVAKGRGMSEAEVKKIAGGRVWTGRRAAEVGLVDEIGGLESAFDYTAALLGKGNRHDLNVVQYPRPKTSLEQLLELIEKQAMIFPAIEVQQKLFNVFRPVVQVVERMEKPQNYSVYESLRIEQ